MEERFERRRVEWEAECQIPAKLFSRVFGHRRSERERRIGDLLHSTGLAPFLPSACGEALGRHEAKAWALPCVDSRS